MDNNRKAAKVINAARKEINFLHAEGKSKLADNLRDFTLTATDDELAKFYDLIMEKGA